MRLGCDAMRVRLGADLLIVCIPDTWDTHFGGGGEGGGMHTAAQKIVWDAQDSHIENFGYILGARLVGWCA